MSEKKKIFVAGHRGMVGSAIIRELKRLGEENIITSNRENLDLTDQMQVRKFFDIEKPNHVYLAAAKVGGIHANNHYPAEFIYENLIIQANVIHESFKSGVEKLLFLGSSCIYPRLAAQPMREELLLTGSLEPTNEPYAIAKIAGIKMCESYNRQYDVDYRSVMPTNLYGVGDNYHRENSHVIPALIKKFHDAKIKKLPTVIVWGSGFAKREFLYVDDLAAASVFVMNLPKDVYSRETSPTCSHLNVGSGVDITIKQLSEAIASVVGYRGAIHYDASKPEGAPRKLIDSGVINRLGWFPRVRLDDGLALAYDDFLKSKYSQEL